MFLKGEARKFAKKKMRSAALIEELTQMTQRHLVAIEQVLARDEHDLNWRAAEGSWSVLECLEHLNRYGNFYLPEIARRIDIGNRKQPEIFKSGWLGDYFAKSMLPKEKLNKMKTFKNMNPLGSDLTKEVTIKFKSQLEEMLRLLETAKGIDLTRTKTSISISNWIKLRLGDTFRVVIYHNERHMAQVKRVLEAAENHTSGASV